MNGVEAYFEAGVIVAMLRWAWLTYTGERVFVSDQLITLVLWPLVIGWTLAVLAVAAWASLLWAGRAWARFLWNAATQWRGR